MASKQALPNLTSIRLLAAMYVFCFHFDWPISARLGDTGVNLFYVLSGFILAYNHPSVESRSRFYVMRFARIYPLYLLSLMIGLPAFVRAHMITDRLALAAIPMSLAMVQSWVPPFRSVLNAAAWTIPVEAFFYFCFPLLLPWVTNHMPRWKVWIAILFIALLVPALIVCVILRPMFPAMDTTLTFGLGMPVFYLAEFVIGMFSGLRFLHSKPVFAGRHVLIACLLLAVSTLAISHLPWQYRNLVYGGILTLPYTLLLYVLAGWQSRWFGHPILQLGGEISYGIYLLQFPVFNILRNITGMQKPPGALHFTVLIVTAYLTYTFLEKPARKRILSALGYHASPKPIPTPGLQV